MAASRRLGTRSRPGGTDHYSFRAMGLKVTAPLQRATITVVVVVVARLRNREGYPLDPL